MNRRTLTVEELVRKPPIEYVDFWPFSATFDDYERAPFCFTEAGTAEHLALDKVAVLADRFRRSIEKLAADTARLPKDATAEFGMALLGEIRERRPSYGQVPASRPRDLAYLVGGHIPLERKVAAKRATETSKVSRAEARRQRSQRARDLRAQGLTYRAIGEQIAREENRRANKADPNSAVVAYSPAAVKNWLRQDRKAG